MGRGIYRPRFRLVIFARVICAHAFCADFPVFADERRVWSEWPGKSRVLMKFGGMMGVECAVGAGCEFLRIRGSREDCHCRLIDYVLRAYN